MRERAKVVGGINQRYIILTLVNNSFGDDQFDDDSDSGANYAVDGLDSEATFADINREKQMNDPTNQRITLKDSLSRLKKMEKDGTDVL